VTPRIAPAGAVDLPAIDAYLQRHADTAMILRSNLRAAGLAWSRERYQGQYMLAWRGDALVGLIGHFWNEMIVVQADETVAALARACVAVSGRPVVGFLGPEPQVREARAALGLADTAASLEDEETLMALGLDALIVPPALAAGTLRGRPARPEDRAALVAWRIAFLVEAAGRAPGAKVEAEAADMIDAAYAGDRLWLVEDAGAPVGMALYNAQLPDCVQIGGVYTPPALRGRGYARAVVAAMLLDARARGVGRALLFTPSPDAAAAYRAIGFTAIGRYGVVHFAAPQPVG